MNMYYMSDEEILSILKVGDEVRFMGDATRSFSLKMNNRPMFQYGEKYTVTEISKIFSKPTKAIKTKIIIGVNNTHLYEYAQCFDIVKLETKLGRVYYGRK